MKNNFLDPSGASNICTAAMLIALTSGDDMTLTKIGKLEISLLWLAACAFVGCLVCSIIYFCNAN